MSGMTTFDLLFLAFKGMAVALVPLTFVWVVGFRPGSDAQRDRYRRLAWVTVFFTFDLILFGGFTRLTDSGLGCPDWPGCYGKANPVAAAYDIRAAEAVLPSGPVTMTKAWIEMIHRYLAMGVGVLIIALMVMAWMQRRQSGRSPRLATALFFLVCLQGAFGAWTVTLKLQPAIVTTHLLLGLLLLAMLTVLASRADGRAGQALPIGLETARMHGLYKLAWIGTALLALQIALGGWVSTNYAVLACTDFPLCQGKLVPPMDFTNGFHLWRDLGRTATQDYLPFEALTAIHWTHRSFAWLVFGVLGWLAWRAWHLPGLIRPARFLAFLLVMQFATGLANVVLHWPLLAAVLHNAGAAGLILTMAVINYHLSQAVSADPKPLADLAHATGS